MTTIAAALLASLTTILGVYFGGRWQMRNTLLTLKHQQALAGFQDERVLRDEKRARIRKSATSLVNIGLTVDQVIRESKFVWKAETEEVRDRRLGRLLSAATADLNPTRLELMLDAGTQDILVAFDRVWNAWTDHQVAQSFNCEAPGTFRFSETQAQLTAFRTALDALIELTRTKLGQFETPLPPLIPAPAAGRGLPRLWGRNRKPDASMDADRR